MMDRRQGDSKRQRKREASERANTKLRMEESEPRKRGMLSEDLSERQKGRKSKATGAKRESIF